MNSTKMENSWTFYCTTFTRLDDSPIFTDYTDHIYTIQNHKQAYLINAFFEIVANFKHFTKKVTNQNYI